MLPNTSEHILAEVGAVHAINIARAGEPVQLRYYGASRSGATGQAHTTYAQAEADVQAWHEGKPVSYARHAEMEAGYTARLAAMFEAGVQAERPSVWGRLKASWSF